MHENFKAFFFLCCRNEINFLCLKTAFLIYFFFMWRFVFISDKKVTPRTSSFVCIYWPFSWNFLFFFVELSVFCFHMKLKNEHRHKADCVCWKWVGSFFLLKKYFSLKRQKKKVKKFNFNLLLKVYVFLLNKISIAIRHHRKLAKKLSLKMHHQS